MSEPRFIECPFFSYGPDGVARPAGTTSREVVVEIVSGRALVGPTHFPVSRPQVHAREKLRWMKAGWVIVGRPPR